MLKTCRVLSNRPICENYRRIQFQIDEMSAGMRPGQFVMIRCGTDAVPYLPRPFSLNSVDREAGTLDILYKVVGQGTALLARTPQDAYLEIHGPLGTAFLLPEGARRIALVGRGVGAAPMRFLAETAVKQGVAVHVYLSAGKREHLFDLAAYEALGCAVNQSTDPTALVTSLLERDLAKVSFDAAYTCGSKRLMRDLARLKGLYGFPAYASVEEHMACGVGACKGCVCRTYDENGQPGTARVCKEGPVFPIERLVR